MALDDFRIHFDVRVLDICSEKWIIPPYSDVNIICELSTYLGTSIPYIQAPNSMSSNLKTLLTSTLPIVLIFGVSSLVWVYVQGGFRPTIDVYDRWLDEYVVDDPIWWSRWRPATEILGRNYASALPSASLESRAQRQERLKGLLDDLMSYRPDDFEDSVNHALLQEQVALEVEGAAFAAHEFPLAPVGGEHLALLELLTMNHLINNQADAKHYLNRVNAIPQLCQEWQSRLNAQAEQGTLPSRQIMQEAQNQLETLATLDPTEHPLYLAFARQASQAEMTALSETAALDIITNIAQSLAQRVQPAFATLARQLEELIPAADTVIGIQHLPDGDAYYSHRLRRYSGGSTDPDSLKRLALAAVQKWEKEIRAYQQAIGQSGSIHPGADMGVYLALKDESEGMGATDERITELLQKLRKDQRNLRDYSRGLTDTVSIVRVGLWSTFPHTWTLTPQYFPATLDTGRSARLRLDPLLMLQQPEATRLMDSYEMLYPGLHLQSSRQSKQRKRPDSRQSFYHPATRAGWQMYSLSLVDDVLAAFYHDPTLRMVYLHRQLQRAVAMRLDVGIHHQGWSYEEARVYLDQRLSLDAASQKQLLLKIISQPGVAVAAVTGYEGLLAIRSRVEQDLGEAFYLQTLHNEWLYQGCLPLPLLRATTQQWLYDQERNP